MSFTKEPRSLIDRILVSSTLKSSLNRNVTKKIWWIGNLDVAEVMTNQKKTVMVVERQSVWKKD